MSEFVDTGSWSSLFVLSAETNMSEVDAVGVCELESSWSSINKGELSIARPRKSLDSVF